MSADLNEEELDDVRTEIGREFQALGPESEFNIGSSGQEVSLHGRPYKSHITTPVHVNIRDIDCCSLRDTVYK